MSFSDPILYTLAHANVPRKQKIMETELKPMKKSGASIPAWAALYFRWLGGLLVERRTSVSQIRGSIPGHVAAV